MFIDQYEANWVILNWRDEQVCPELKRRIRAKCFFLDAFRLSRPVSDDWTNSGSITGFLFVGSVGRIAQMPARAVVWSGCAVVVPGATERHKYAEILDVPLLQ